MVKIIKSNSSDINELMSIRLEIISVVNQMNENDKFDEVLINCLRDYFLNGDQTTVLAKDNDKVIGCASICYIKVMPSFNHPTGLRAHIMNVYTKASYRRQSIGRRMVEVLVKEAKAKGCTEISLDTTEEGYLFYEKLGFHKNIEGMVLVF